jgi:hypothetical protein
VVHCKSNKERMQAILRKKLIYPWRKSLQFDFEEFLFPFDSLVTEMIDNKEKTEMISINFFTKNVEEKKSMITLTIFEFDSLTLSGILLSYLGSFICFSNFFTNIWMAMIRLIFSFSDLVFEIQYTLVKPFFKQSAKHIGNGLTRENGLHTATRR